MNGASSELEDIAASGLDILGIGRICFIPVACKVCVGVALKSRVDLCWKDQTFVLGPDKVANDALDRGVVG